MPSKVLVERLEIRGDGSRVWNRVKVPLHHSMRGNLYVKCEDRIYVFESLKEGCPVVAKVNGEWKPVGRITPHNVVFLGDGLSYEEFLRSPQGRAYCEEFIKNVRMGRV